MDGAEGSDTSIRGMITLNDYRIRQGMASDAPVISRHRALMFYEMGHLPEAEMASFARDAGPIIEAVIRGGTYWPWFAENASGDIVAGGGVQLRPLLPRPECRQAPEAIILNMYVEPAHRRRGLARRLLEGMIDWCRSQNIVRIVLHPSDQGRALYESMGFQPTGELRWRES
jgi:GNAT superfamily N-acetyltransferase